MASGRGTDTHATWPWTSIRSNPFQEPPSALPPSAARLLVRPFEGHLFSNAHRRTSRCPRKAAWLHVDTFPIAPVFTRPLQNMRVAALRGLAAGGRAPRAVVRTGQSNDVQVSSQRCAAANPPVVGTTVDPKPAAICPDVLGWSPGCTFPHPREPHFHVPNAKRADVPLEQHHCKCPRPRSSHALVNFAGCVGHLTKGQSWGGGNLLQAQPREGLPEL